MTTEDVESWKLKFFTDEYMMKIFQALMDSPKTAQQISSECNVSIATVYRKLKALEERQLIQTSGVISNGVRIKKYQNNSMN